LAGKLDGARNRKAHAMTPGAPAHLELISHQMNEVLNRTRALQRNIETLIQATARLDHSSNALREDLRHRIETLEATRDSEAR
jgi:uncharacterized protein YoxC